MSDFKAHIIGQLDLSKAKSEMNQFLNNYKDKPIKVDVRLNKNNELENLKSQIKQLSSQKINIRTTTQSWKSGVNSIEKDFQMLKNLANEISQKKIKISGLDSSKNQNQIRALSTQLKKLESDYKSLYNTFGNSLDKNQIGQLENIFGKTSDKVNELKAKAKDLSKTFSDIKPISQLEADIAANKTLTWLKNNTKAAKEYGDTLERLADRQRNATNTEDLKKYTKQVNSIKAEASAKGLTGKSFGDEFKRAFKQIAEFAGVYGVIRNVVYQIPRQMVQNVLEVDDAMTNLQMATGVSNEKAQELMRTYSQLGDQLKATGTDVATSATEWMKQGKSIEESQKLAKDSIVLSKIGNLSAEESTKTITAAMKSYDLDESEVMGFIDKISAIDMASATSVGGLSDAFNKVAANARNAGIESEKVLAYAAAIGETTQEGMDSVGTSLNSIFSRMGNIKLSRLKDPESGEDLSNVETSLRNVGIELRESTGQFRDFDKVLDETASRWDTFSEVTQRSIASSFAGTHHMNEFLVLMQSYSKAQEYMQIATNSSGESLKKYEAYTDSAKGKLEGFKNSFQTFSTTTLDSDLFNGAIDGGTLFLNVLTQIMDVGGGLPAIAASIAGIMSAKGKGKQNNNYRSLNALSYKIA